MRQVKQSLPWLMMQVPHANGRVADDAVKGEKQRGQDEDDHQNADHGAPSHQHAHGADNVNVGVDGNAKGCGEQSHARYDDGGDGGKECRMNGILPVGTCHTFHFISCGHQNSVVHGRAKLDRTNADRRDKGKALAEVMRKSKIDKDGNLDDGDQDKRQGEAFLYQGNDDKDG